MTEEGEVSEEDRAKFLAWATHVRNLHRTKRAVAMIACGLGVALMAWSRFGAGPAWGVLGGLGVIVASWLVLAWIVWDRYWFVRRNPFDENQPTIQP